MQHTQLDSRLRPEIGDHKDKGAALYPGEEASGNGSEERRGANDNDIGSAYLFPAEQKSRQAKGELGKNAPKEAFIRSNVGPYTHHMHTVQHLFLHEMSAILGRDDACWI